MYQTITLSTELLKYSSVCFKKSWHWWNFQEQRFVWHFMSHHRININLTWSSFKAWLT